MLLRDCYSSFEGDYDDVIQRFLDDERVKKFLKAFIKDDNYYNLKEAVINKEYDKAFTYAHTLKGISLNLSLTKLSSSIIELTEVLRNKKELEKVNELFNKTTLAYNKVIDVLNVFLGEN